MSWGNRDECVQRLVDARVALVRLEDAHALQGVDEWHEAMFAVAMAARALRVSAVNLDAMVKAQQRVEDEANGER